MSPDPASKGSNQGFGKLYAVTFNDHVRVKILLVQKNVPDKTTDGVRIVPKGVGDASNGHQELYDLSRKALSEQFDYPPFADIGLPLHAVHCKSRNACGFAYKDIEQVGSCNNTYHAAIFHYGKQTLFIGYDLFLDFRKCCVRTYGIDIDCHVFAYRHVFKFVMNGFFYDLT